MKTAFRSVFRSSIYFSIAAGNRSWINRLSYQSSNMIPERLLESIHRCNDCGLEFSSRNKLFMHLKATEEGHNTDSSTKEQSLLHGQPSKKQCTKQRNCSGTFINPPGPLSPDKVPLDSVDKLIVVVQEDDWYRVIVKPQGLATMGFKGVTLMSSPMMMLPDAMKLNLRYKKAVPCHRLDRDTGGLMVCSKSKLAERVLMTCFRAKLVRKQYLAMVAGRLEPAFGIVDNPISGKRSVTRYEVTSYTRSVQYGWVSTVKLWPITGCVTLLYI